MEQCFDMLLVGSLSLPGIVNPNCTGVRGQEDDSLINCPMRGEELLRLCSGTRRKEQTEYRRKFEADSRMNCHFFWGDPRMSAPRITLVLGPTSPTDEE